MNRFNMLEQTDVKRAMACPIGDFSQPTTNIYPQRICRDVCDTWPCSDLKLW
jgi:hypothetical protein